MSNIGWFVTKVLLYDNCLEANILQRGGNNPKNEYYFYLLKDGEIIDRSEKWGATAGNHGK